LYPFLKRGSGLKLKAPSLFPLPIREREFQKLFLLHIGRGNSEEERKTA